MWWDLVKVEGLKGPGLRLALSPLEGVNSFKTVAGYGLHFWKPLDGKLTFGDPFLDSGVACAGVGRY